MDGRELSGMSRRQVARVVGLVPQQTKMTAQITVYDAVALGRLPHQDLTGKLLQEDEKLIQDAVTRTELDGLLLREVSQLSGGEAQRVAVAMVLAQAPSVFLLDEPSSALDPRHTVKVFSLLRSLVGSSQSGKIVVAAVHDVNLAVRFADFFLAMKNGKILSGAPVGALDENILEALYDVPFESYVSSKGEKAWHTK
jgi:iron complex transport system ATP-binding protein